MMHSGQPYEHNVAVKGEHSLIEVAKFITVIAVIFGLSLILTSSYSSFSFEEWSRLFMGVFFVVFASFKFVGYKMFSMMFAGYDVIAKRSMLYSHLYPFIELGLGLAYLFNIAPVARDISTLIIMSVGTIGVYQEIKKRSGIHCACLGNLIKLPLSSISLVEDVGMGLMALIMLVIR